MREIFLSSTARDLGDYCAELAQALNALKGYKCVWMKNFYASDSTSVEFVQKRVQECDLYIGVIGMLFGSCPLGSQKSFTQHEYEAAITKNMPRLIFMTTEDFRLPANLRESDTNSALQGEFRHRLQQERICKFINDERDLKASAIASLKEWEVESVEAPAPAKPMRLPAAEPNLGLSVHQLCDRGPQEDVFKVFFRQKIKEIPGVPQIYIVSGEERESLQSLIDRFCTVTIEKHLIPQLNLPREPVTRRLVDWPDPNSPSPKDALLDRLFARVAEEEAYPDPNAEAFVALRLLTYRGILALKHEVRVPRWTQNLLVLVEWYCRFWDQVASHRPARQLVVFLSILYPDGTKEEGWKSWLPFSVAFGPCERDLIDLQNRRQRETENNPRMCPIIRLPELRCVGHHHVMDWFSTNGICELHERESHREKLFTKRDCVHMANLEPELEKIVASYRKQRQ